ncbi:MAG: glycosyltransferase [Rikenellaceae bacterium]
MEEKKIFVLIAPSNKEAYELMNKLAFVMQFSLYEIYVISPNRDEAEILETLGIQIIEVAECKDSSNFLSALSYIFSLRSVLRRLKPDATLGYATNAAIYGSIAARLSGVRSISCLITQTGYLPYFYKLGFAAAHNVIFQDYNDRYVHNLLGFVKSDNATVINGNADVKVWSIDFNDQLIDAMKLKM